MFRPRSSSAPLLLLAGVSIGACVARAGADCPPTVTLGGYQLVATYPLPASTLSESSGIAWNWDTDTLFVMPDTGVAVVEVTKAGVVKSMMPMTGFQDTEGICYLGNGQFAAIEERLGRAYRFTYAAGATLNRANLPFIQVGPNTGTNSGSEGASWDPRDGSWVSIKEKDTENVFRVTGSFATQQSTYVDLFPAANLNVADIADVMVMSTVPTLVGGADEDNLLIISQASNRLLKVTRAGVVLGSLNLASLNDNPEGVAMDAQRRIYIVGDSTAPKMYVFAPPATDACTCPADIDRNHVVDGADLGALLSAWGPAAPGAPADLDFNGSVDGADLGALLSGWGACR